MVRFKGYIKTATAKYTPTVTPITVTPTDKVSEDIQNVPQTQTPTFELSNDKTAENHKQEIGGSSNWSTN